MRILLTKNNENTVALPLSSNLSITGSPVYFLFRFINSENSSEKLFTGEDSSNNTSRYNKFNFIESGSTYENLTASTFNLNPGVYNYEVYQMLSQTNLSLTGVSGSFILNGTAQVSGSTLTTGQSNKYTGQTNSNTIYYNR